MTIFEMSLIKPLVSYYTELGFFVVCFWYHISNKIIQCQLNGKKRPHVNIFICIEMARHENGLSKEKKGTHLHWSICFVRLVHFQMFIFKKKIMNKWPHGAYPTKSLLFNITPTGSCQKCTTTKKTPCITENLSPT